MNKKKSIISTLIAASMLATSVSAFAFSDVSDSHWAKSYIDDLSSKSYINGYEDGSYRPDNYVTRAEFLAILVNIFKPSVKDLVYFSDVNASAWYAETMTLAANAGYVSGYGDGIYRPEENISRQEAAVIIYRAWTLTPEGSAGFTDVNDIADWAKNEIATLATKNIINGYEDGSFRPSNYITRAEVSKMIAQAITLGIKEEGTSAFDNTGTNSGTSAAGVIHSSGTVTNASSSSSSSGGGSSSSGSKTSGGSGSSSKTTVTPVSDKEYEEKVDTKDPAEDAVVTAELDASKVVDAIDAAVTDGALTEGQDVILDINVDGLDKVENATVTYFMPVKQDDGTYKLADKPVTKSADEFQKDMEALKEIPVSQDDAKKILDNISFQVPTGTDTSKISTTVAVKDPEDTEKEIVKETETSASVNYVIEALKSYQTNTASSYNHNYDLAVIINNYVEDRNESGCKTWITNNARRIQAYQDVAASVVDLYKGVEITEDNYKTYKEHFDVMKSVVDNAAAFAAQKNGKLTKTEALEYFNTTVANEIDAANIEYAEDVKTAAKSFCLKLSDKLELLNDAVSKGSSTINKRNLVFDVYNGEYTSK